MSICRFLPSSKVRTRGLPDDHVGSVRVVTIEGMETNMCCGTHVSNLSHLQVTAPNVVYILSNITAPIAVMTSIVALNFLLRIICLYSVGSDVSYISLHCLMKWRLTTDGATCQIIYT